MKKMTKKQVIKAASKITKEATKSLDKILKDNDMFFDPINKTWNEGPIDHTKDEHNNWECITIRENCRDGADLFYELIYDEKDDDKDYIQDLLYTRKELEEYIEKRRSENSPINRIKKLQDEINRLKEKYNIKD